MCLILAIETSSDVGSIALAQGASVISEIELPDRRNHSKVLLSTIEKILHDNQVSKEAVDVCAVSKGPGSFTGVRIGVTAAKTLAWALGWKVAGVDSLLVRAQAALESIPDGTTQVRPRMEALQQEYFYACYTRELTVIEPPQLITAEVFHAQESRDDIFEVTEDMLYPRASHLCALVAQNPALISGDVHGLCPLYLKKSSAERHYDTLEKQS